MPIANVDMEGKYVKALLAYEEAQKYASDEESKMHKLVSTLEEKKNAVSSQLTAFSNFWLIPQNIYYFAGRIKP